MKSIFKFASVSALVIGTLSTGVAHAGNCPPITVESAGVAGNGGVLVTGSGAMNGVTAILHHVHLCNVVNPVGAWQPDSCRELFKLLTSAVLSGKKVTLRLAAPNGSCSPAPFADFTTSAFGFDYAWLAK